MLKITLAWTLALLLCSLCLLSCRNGSEDKEYTIGFRNVPEAIADDTHLAVAEIDSENDVAIKEHTILIVDDNQEMRFFNLHPAN